MCLRVQGMKDGNASGTRLPDCAYHQCIQLTSPCVGPSGTSTKLVVLVLFFFEAGVLKPSMVVTFAPANVTTEIKFVEMHHHKALCKAFQ